MLLSRRNGRDQGSCCVSGLERSRLKSRLDSSLESSLELILELSLDRRRLDSKLNSELSLGLMLELRLESGLESSAVGWGRVAEACWRVGQGSCEAACRGRRSAQAYQLLLHRISSASNGPGCDMAAAPGRLQDVCVCQGGGGIISCKSQVQRG